MNGDYLKKDGFPRDPEIFLSVQNFLRDKQIDFLIGNLESPLKGNGENILKDPRIFTDALAAESLKQLSPAVFNLANNHIYDCLEEGFKNTREWLQNNGFNFFGAGLNSEEAERPLTLEKNGDKITILSYVAPDTHPSLPENCGVYLNLLDQDKVLSEVKNYSQHGLIVVMLHWGMEFSLYPTPEQRHFARALIDAGAKLVIGHHAHMLQGLESYKDGFIFYNLGNLAFADVYSASNPVLWTTEQLRGGLALIDIKEGQIMKAVIIPTCIDNLAVKIEQNKKRNKQVKRRSFPLKLNIAAYKIFWSIYYFKDFVFKRPFRYFFGERKNFLKQLSVAWMKIVKK